MSVVHVVVMGVAGSGKSTVGALLAEALGRPFAEGDDFHSATNVAKMHRGTPLTDHDRADWLAAIRDWMSEEARHGRGVVLTCSALRRTYRDTLREARGAVVFLHLSGSIDEIQRRMAERSGHFMPVSLLPSQLATLEPLGEDEDGVTVHVEPEPADIVARALPAIDLYLTPRPQNGSTPT